MPQNIPYDNDTAQAEFLLLKRLSQPLSEEENDVLSELLKNPDIQDLEREILSNNNAGIYAAKDEDLQDPALAYIDFSRRIRQKRNRRIVLYSVAAVGILVLATKMMSFWLMPEKSEPIDISSKVSLSIGNESTVLLDRSRDVLIDKQPLNVKDTLLDLSKQDLSSKALSILNVPKGLTYKIILNDGSVVRLNSASQLKFPLKFNGDTREVYLNGEAYFNIAKDAAHPFLVHTNNETSIRVLGTEFNVNTYTENIVKTSLVSGAVQINSVVLKPDEEYIYDGHAGHIAPLDARNTLSWLKGVYFFNSTSFEEISQVLDRNFGHQVVFADSSIAHRAYSGIIDRSSDVEGFLKSLQASAAFTYSIDHNTVYISK